MHNHPKGSVCMANVDGSLKFDTKIDDSGFNSGVNKLGSVASKGMKLVGAAFATATAAVSGMGMAAIKVGSDFEAQMSRVQAISGATGEEFKKLRDLALQLGADTSFSATEAAQGMENLAAAGFSVQETMEAMPGLLDLAAASGEDLSTSSDIAASAIRGFGLEASEAAHVADVLAENANRTNSSVAGTGEAMKYAAPLARAAGISFEETAAAIGIMANAGIQGSQAGTTLRGAISRLSKPTDAMYTVMEKLGISFYDSEGKMKSLTEQIAMLDEAMEGMTDEEKNNALVTLYGQEALSGMLALINEGSDELDALTKSFENCDGAAQRTASVMQDNLKGAVEQLKGSAETLGIIVYDSMAEPLKEMAQLGTEAINDLIDGFEKGGIKGVVSAAGNVTAQLVAKLVKELPNLISLGVSFAVSFAQGLTQSLPSVLASASSLISTLTGYIVNSLPLMLTQGMELLASLSRGFVQGIPSFASKALDAIQQFATNLAGQMPLIIQKGFEVLSNLVQGIMNALPVLIAKVPKIITTFANIINDNFPTILAKGAQLLLQLVKGILSAIPTLIANIPQIIEAIWSTIMAINWMNLGKSVIDLFGKGIKSLTKWVGDRGKDVAKSIWNQLTHLPQTLWNLGKNMLSKLGNSIVNSTGTVKGAVKGVFNAVVNGFKSLPSQLIQIGKNLIQGLWNGIGSMKDWILGKIGGFTDSIVGGIKDFFGIHSPSRVMRDMIGKFLPMGIEVGFSKQLPKSVKAMDEEMKNELEIMRADAIDYNSNPVPQSSNVSNTTNNQNVKYEVNQTFNGTGTPKPSEVARETRDALRREQWE